MSSLFLTSFTQNLSSLLLLHCHCMTNAFEFMFSSIICPPGCFSMYHIKAPKGDTSYWVPILANLECCRCPSQEKSSRWRYLTTLMLKIFPKHKDAFCPQAICKTIAPNTFRIFLFQWHCWTTSTIHSLAEPVLARDLYGNFCSRYSAAWLAKSNSMTVLLGTLKTLSSGSWRHRLQHMIHNISIGMYRLSLLSTLSSPQLTVPWLFWHGYVTTRLIELEMS